MYTHFGVLIINVYILPKRTGENSQSDMDPKANSAQSFLFLVVFTF